MINNVSTCSFSADKKAFCRVNIAKMEPTFFSRNGSNSQERLFTTQQLHIFQRYRLFLVI